MWILGPDSTINILEVLIIAFSCIGIGSHLTAIQEALQDVGAIAIYQSKKAETLSGNLVLIVAKGHVRSEKLRCAVKAFGLAYGIIACTQPDGPLSDSGTLSGILASACVLGMLGFLSLETIWNRKQRHTLIRNMVREVASA
jgi:hypothetical protein